jgi:Kef-type K+ transport system membrane component KefB
MTEEQLLRFLLEVVVLFVAARVGGELAVRVHLPSHIGELVMGIVLGPSLFGVIWPEAFDWLFPADPSQRALLDVVGWIAVILLVLLAGLETRLGIMRRAGRAAIGASVGGFVLPFAVGFALGLAAPEALVPSSIGGPLFATFIATAMSISAIPVIARILSDLDLYRTAVGMVILAAALASDVLGWIIVSLVSGWAGDTEGPSVSSIVLWTAVFLVAGYLVGRPVVAACMRLARERLRMPFAEPAMMLLLVFAGAAATQAIGIHLVLGALVIAILIGRTQRGPSSAVDGVTSIAMGFFAPLFFAYTGLKVDLTTLDGAALAFGAAAVVVACAGKVVGGGIGARAGGLPTWEALAVGFGLNARGAMELVIATIGLSIGVLTEASYAILVLIAVVTTIMAAPTLRWCMRRAGPAALRRARPRIAASPTEGDRSGSAA